MTPENPQIGDEWTNLTGHTVGAVNPREVAVWNGKWWRPTSRYVDEPWPAMSDKVQRIDEMTDAEIVAAVRGKSHALIPIGENTCVGMLDLDAWEQFEGQMGVIMALTKDECKFVAPQIFP